MTAAAANSPNTDRGGRLRFKPPLLVLLKVDQNRRPGITDRRVRYGGVSVKPGGQLHNTPQSILGLFQDNLRI
jgi:hypothetical protein